MNLKEGSTVLYCTVSRAESALARLRKRMYGVTNPNID